MSGFAFINSKKLTDLIRILQKVLADYFTHVIRVLCNHLGAGVRTKEHV